jgi:exosortase E/protease (VPEID-CTERM system)
MAVPLSHRLADLPSYKPSGEAPGEVSLSTGFLKNLALLLAIVCAEVAFYYRFSDGAAIMRHGASPELQAGLAIGVAELRDLVAVCVAAMVIFTWTAFSALIKSAIADSPLDSDHNRRLWVHIFFAALLIGWASIDPRYVSSPTTAVAWNLSRLVLLSAALGSALLALIPLRLWLRWYLSSRAAVFTGAAFGLAAWIIRFPVRSVWWSTDRATLFGSYLMLRLFGQQPTMDMPQHLLGVGGFTVAVEPQCAGFEGVALIALVTGLYLWLWRKELRFPHVLVLLPIGIATSWLLNMGRIAALVMIGVRHPDFALSVFHSIAGWALFNLIGVGLIAASNEFAVFRADSSPVPAMVTASDTAGAYLLPLIVLIVAGMLTRPFSGEFPRLYPICVIVAGCVLLAYRREYLKLDWNLSWSSIAIGAIVSLFWVILSPLSPSISSAGFVNGLHGLSPEAAALWIAFRVIGTIAIVPMAEELAFRGYLLRKLISADFESVAANRFTWLSFLLSSVLFGAMHDYWIGGTLTGMAFAVALYRSGRISDAILAHATSNALIAIFVLTTGSWSLWS